MIFNDIPAAKFIERNSDLVSILGERMISRHYLNDGVDHEVLNDIEDSENSPRLFCDGDTVYLVYRNGKFVVESPMVHGRAQPAIQRKNGDLEYWQNNQLHREDGPAVIGKNRHDYSWFKHGKRHREDGPAAISFGCISYFLEGEYYNFEDWVKIVYQKLSC